ncbi:MULTISPECIES: Pycsar system effector family protein [unclassified Mesoflavibacter]|uniref:Pycsar system effector family protein n=1 Tax=unclassified Mesoflavibacter TaxID=2630131 RepID=UPI001CA9B37F|nr:Pycsar system effector family protein [Mesoflavibacter sp. SCSIO 43206]UAB76063.1 HD domain-containing protein [Mesoflavibacter sp. SCSIO 43206]
MTKLVEKTESFVFELFKNELPDTIVYHNHTHTKRVFKCTKEIIENSEINVNDAEILMLAALLHDTGYTKTRDDHEDESAKIAEDFLKKEGADQKVIDSVKDCIMATKVANEPKTELDKILRDADASHFGKKYFNEASEFLRKELEINGIATFTPSEWLDENIKMLSKKHRFYTDYALKNWQPRKEKNLAKLIKTKKKHKRKIKKEKIKAKYKAQYKNESPERGIQTFYRVALRNHIKLSDIADTKANILLSVNAIIISVVLANLISKLDTNPYLTWPTVIFTVFSVISMVMSIIATRPNVTSGEFTKEDVANKEVNLTFFGNFHKMDLKEYEWAIEELLKDKNYVYKSLTKDLYFLGKVLERKYRLLRITYTVFMIGIITSLIAFGIAVKNNPGTNIEDVLDTTSIIKTDMLKDKKSTFYL